MLKQIKLRNFLSYEDLDLPLERLNVLIGANGSGKSNLLEALRLLQATPSDFSTPLRLGGGVNEWIKKGKLASSSTKLEVVFEHSELIVPIRYGIEFGAVQQRVAILDEYIENERQFNNARDVYFFYRYQNGNPVINEKSSEAQQSEYEKRQERRLKRDSLSPEQSVLSQRADVDIYPELTLLGKEFSRIRNYSDLDVSRTGLLRRPQAADGKIDFLSENADNLALILNDLIFRGLRSKLIKDLQIFSDAFSDIVVRIEGATVQIFLHESELITIPTTRLSDGTLRFLCLLAILRHPKPPSIICIEEPEIGMHPDIMPTIADLLIDASQRSQVFVTTHSDALISSITSPQMVLVCERDDVGSHIRKLDSGSLQEWLEDYTLGDLWRMGELGGKRW